MVSLTRLAVEDGIPRQARNDSVWLGITQTKPPSDEGGGTASAVTEGVKKWSIYLGMSLDDKA